jgi:hypothetical protein
MNVSHEWAVRLQNQGASGVLYILRRAWPTSFTRLRKRSIKYKQEKIRIILCCPTLHTVASSVRNNDEKQSCAAASVTGPVKRCETMSHKVPALHMVGLARPPNLEGLGVQSWRRLPAFFVRRSPAARSQVLRQQKKIIHHHHHPHACAYCTHKFQAMERYA